MSIHLIHDLEVLHRHILNMCAQVEELIHASVDLLSQPDREKMVVIQNRDNTIDELDVQIEEECLKLLALHQPVAIDLRRITSVMKISAELERVADLGVNIAERACGLISYHELAVPKNLTSMAKLSLDMLHQSIDAYVQLDVRMARSVCLADDEVDRLNREIIQDLIRLMTRRTDLIEPAIHLFSASRQIERVADHATNIAEDVVYLVHGEIIRHRNRESLDLLTERNQTPERPIGS